MKEFSKKLSTYIISNQQRDLLTIFEKFSDKITYPEDNIFFIQNEILDKILTNIEECKKSKITFLDLYKGITEEEKSYIESIDLENKINHNAYHSSIIEVEYFNEEEFMSVIDEELENIATNYNLNAQDDYNKLYMFISSIQLSLQSSDDVLQSLSNQYVFLKEHYNDESISIYGKKSAKLDILNNIIDLYKIKIKKQNVKKAKGSKNTRH